MDAKIAGLAVAEFAAIAPAPRMNARIVIAPFGRADIHLPIDVLRRRAARSTTSTASVITMDIYVSDFAQGAAADVMITSFESVPRAATIESALHGASIFVP